MSQVLEKLISLENKQEHTKLWQVLDDVIKNKTYEQAKGTYIKSDQSKRCVLGAVFGGDLDDMHINAVRAYIKFNIKVTNEIPLGMSKEGTIKEFKEIYKKTGGIASHNHITYLNDMYSVSFEEFRDLFYEMNI